MSENSLFALLLRSPWWISFVLVACVALISKALVWLSMPRLMLLTASASR